MESALFGTGGEGGERTAETYQGKEADKEDGKTRKKSVHFQSDSQAAMVVLLLSSRIIRHKHFNKSDQCFILRLGERRRSPR